MSRELKFRAYDPYLKKMLYTSFSIIGEVTLFGALEVAIMENPIPGISMLERLNALIVTDFTGKRDKYGKDIYNGDINQDNGKVVWNNDSASFCWEYDFDLLSFEDEDKWCEIIGNIYEQLQN